MTTGHGPTRRSDDSGNAVVEFVTLGMLLLVPLVYLVVTLGRIQAASFAVDGAAREAARVLVTAPDEATGRARALAAIRLGLLDQGFAADPARVLAISCPATGCLTPQGQVAVEVTYQVTLPGVPAFVDAVVPVRVTVRARQLVVVDAFAGTGRA
jgi:Flp pilus assembly protein TadG